MSSVMVQQGSSYRVTGLPKIAGSGRRGARLVAGRMPASHLLVKDLGVPVDISWGVTNNGDEVGAVRLWLFAFDNGGLVLETPQVTIMPGATVTLSLSWPSSLPPGDHQMLLIMANQSVGATDPVAEHQFTVSVPVSSVGPILAAGSLSIT